MLGYKKALVVGVAVSAAALIAAPSVAATTGGRQSRFVVHAAKAAPLGTWGGGGGGARTTKCFGLYPGRGVSYAPGCYGEDEPQINPFSTVPDSASNITWTFVLGTDAPRATATIGVKYIDLGPTFSVDAAVNDTKSLDDAALAELQFYPDTVLKS